MGKNKFENFIFSITVCFLMVSGMTMYNAVLVSASAPYISAQEFALQFLIIFCLAFIIDWFIVAPLVKKIVARFTNEQTPFIKKVIFISGLMVLFMCTAMSLVAMLLHGYQAPFGPAYVKTFAINFVFALPLQFFIVGPIARAAFFKVFPAPMPARG